ncbi:hypothetical protein PPSIR1_20729 [Plesiocystis pacifica SIR-1]|uniref:Uncharacterized protein n=1 Tax=Plesiocystis pacifica SIR-1 TaxID=391625 RepID=A6G2C2_9BACT|nr:hypothetical protein [Plesiocystis pacifica]EDM80091.1 hypothetical protein PPSIR1_20729 [Plesiocystis pacifica SIR-1]
MAEPPNPRVNFLAALLVLTYLAGTALLVLTPELGLRALEKEGAVEQASHLVLVAAIVAYAVVALRSRRPLVLLLSLFLTLVLLEELDWGDVYSQNQLATFFQAETGDVNFHNRWGGHSYLLFALPVPAYGLSAFYPAWLREPLERALGPAAPDRRASVAMLACVATLIVGLLALSAYEQQLDELNELVIYLWFGGVAALAARPQSARESG